MKAVFAELNPTLSQEPHMESTDQVPRWGRVLSTAKFRSVLRGPGPGLPTEAGNLCFPIPLQSIWRLQANDQDWAAGNEAKNSHRANNKELAGLVARETSRRESNQAGRKRQTCTQRAEATVGGTQS